MSKYHRVRVQKPGSEEVSSVDFHLHGEVQNAVALAESVFILNVILEAVISAERFYFDIMQWR